ncbi:hypothetical protein V501_03729 [Pseudogymnoascus sp. VKM F-4519 (FW-2642)]|nr:hypothetical protein V501_03729 [Pseudogymnoascus sp. VKM F-4519 (FW-2642)]
MMQPSMFILYLLPLALATAFDLTPTVKLPSGANVIGSSIAGIDSFKGIPFAQPPVGQLRLRPPRAIVNQSGNILATGIPKACPQLYLPIDTSNIPAAALGLLLNTPLVQTVTNAGEDCLTVNVQRPASATSSSKLPVIFWIYGGSFQFGSTQIYDGSFIIKNSVQQRKDVIFVAVNYRVGGFGFLPGKEVLKDGSANLGLLDQRLGLQWVADNIASFGGDPDKVTIWGESAGSISIFDQLALYGGNHTYQGKPLFRAAIMDSGSIIPTEPVAGPRSQAVYDRVVKNAGCSSAADTLSCLRGTDYTTFLNAANNVPGGSIAGSYLPRADGSSLMKAAHLIAQEGSYAPVPFIIGDQEDEGTLFSLTQFNLTNEQQLVDYFSGVVFPNASRSTVQGLVDTYSADPTAGSPYNTGLLNNLYPEFKRLASIQGDIVFTLQRRLFLALASVAKPEVASYSYLSSSFYGTPILGTFHATDVLQAFGYIPGIPAASMQAYYISFVNTMDPNQGTSALLPKWPKWSAGKKLLNFRALSNTLIPDNFREASYEYLAANIAELTV